MKTSLKTLVIVGALTVAATACKENTNQSDLTQADLEFAAQVMGATMSDETDGVMSSVYDATSNVDASGITYGTGTMKLADGMGGGRDHKGDSSRGAAKNFTYSYDAATGTHTMSMERSISNQRLTKSVSAIMKNIFKHESGAFIVFPKQNRDSVNSIYFTSSKTGSDESPRRTASFTRIDTMSIVGLSQSATILDLNGSHFGTGNMTVITGRGDTLTKYHDVSIKYTNVSVDKATVVANQNLEEGVTGTIDYRIVTYNSRNGADEKIVEGTVEMTGDGTALMRFKGRATKAIINLTDGSTEVEG